MSKIWNYFTLSGRIAFCKECDYKKDFPPRAPTLGAKSTTDFFSAKSTTDDPFKYWSGENSIKWPLLTKLSHRYFSAPATSSESERFIENKFYFNPLNF